jgi:hypothetical protein
MNIQHYKPRLLDLEKALSARIGHEATVDGGPIEERWLEALPWTPYCLKHEQRLEVAASSRPPTL